MYNMYSWDPSAGTPDDHAETAPAEARDSRAARRVFADAVQVSLDRRDNGGDAARRARRH